MTARPISPKVRGMVRALSTAACAARLTAREAEFVISIRRQASRPRWMPTPRQANAIRRLYAGLAAAKVTIIDDDSPKRKAAADILKLEGIEQ